MRKRGAGAAKQSSTPTQSNRDGLCLIGKTAVVTGGNRGIGLAIAKALVMEGCRVLISGRDRATLKQAQAELQGAVPLADQIVKVLVEVCDVRDQRSVDGLFAIVNERFGALDFLVNNAGVSHAMAEVAKLSPDVWNEVIATNLTGTYLCTRAALPLMDRGGVIVNNLSVAAKSVFAGEAAYCASKHGALGFTNTLREELRPRGIRVIGLVPGPTDTDIWNQFWPDAPRRRMLRPETVGKAVVDALLLPTDASMDEILLTPASGTL